MARYERKYVINVADFIAMERRLCLVMQKDPHCVNGSYPVRSLYFDSIDDAAVSDILEGVLNKQKVRLRTYDVVHGPFILEHKCRSGELGIKEKVEVTREEADQLSQGRFGFLSDHRSRVASELYAKMTIGCYLPRSIVVYQRVAYVAELSDCRVTFDSDVGGSYATRDFLMEHPPLTPLLRPGVGVLEVKYDDFLPSYIKEAVGHVDGIMQANSKYLQSRLWTL